MDRTKKHLHLLDRIKNLDLYAIENMSPETMMRVTDGFEESLVRNVIYTGTTNFEQRKIIKYVKEKYNNWNQSINFLWIEEYPEYINNLQMDIECGMVITPQNENNESEYYASNNQRVKELEEKIAKQDAKIKELQENSTRGITQEEFDAIFNLEKINGAKGKENTHTDITCENKLESRIKELEEENKRLNELTKNLQKKLDEANTIPDSITAQQRVRMELARLLMEKAGINETVLDKWGNKDKAGTIMSIISDITPTTCKTYLSDPTINKGYHEKTISNINTLLESLGLDFKL